MSAGSKKGRKGFTREEITTRVRDQVRRMVVRMGLYPLANRMYFFKHRKELARVSELLEDERSKRLFKTLLRYRGTCNKKRVQRALDAFVETDNQYLVPEVAFSDHEVIIDCGAYIGDTAEIFFKAVPGCRVVALEPDKSNFEKLSALEFEGLTALNYGVWSENKTLTFRTDKGPSGSISAAGEGRIEVRALDRLAECQDATVIKMDVEGVELEALKGARQIIRRNKPKLEICVYHKPRDLFELPFYIKELRPDYKFYLHHHTHGDYETVLYAI